MTIKLYRGGIIGSGGFGTLFVPFLADRGGRGEKIEIRKDKVLPKDTDGDLFERDSKREHENEEVGVEFPRKLK